MDIEKPQNPTDKTPGKESERGPLRSFFDFFRKKPETTPEKEAAPKSPETKDAKPEKRSFGEKLLKLLRVKEEHSQAEPRTTSAPEHTLPPVQETKERKTHADRLLAGARRLGQTALNLLTDTRRGVQEAEARVPEAEATNITPLNQAESNVREALDEVEEVTHKVEVDPNAAASYEMGGGDFDGRHEAAHRAWREADRAIEAENRRQQRSANLLGVAAVGAGLFAAGVGVVNWLKLRAVRQEQAEAKKRDKRERAELRTMRQELSDNRQRLQELRQTQLQDMNREQRQEHVYSVSDYANVQAEKIRDAAKLQEERLAERAVANVVRLPERPLPLDVMPVSAEAEKAPEKKRRVMERVAEIIASGKAASRSEGLGGAIGGAVGGVMDLFTGRRVPPTDQPTTKPQPAQPRQPQPVQTWLNGILLILGVILLIVILMAIG